MMPIRRPCFARCLLPFFLLLCVVVCAGCAKEQFAPTTDLDNFQKLQQQKEQAEIKPEVQAVTPAAMTADNPADYLLGAGDLVTVTVGEEYLGSVMTDLSGRRGRVLGSDSVNRKAIVRALVPQAELSRYAIDLRGIGHGSGTFTREFHGYELLPHNLLDKYARK